MKKTIFIIGLLIASVLLSCVVLKTIKEKDEEITNNQTIEQKETKLNSVLSLEDEINNNTIWCGTFNLIWNDLKDIAKQNIILEKQTKEVDNLNKSTFTTKELNEKSYYKTQGYQTPALKKEIEKNIKEKFNEESDILDGFTFEDPTDKYLLYVMLSKAFEYNTQFDDLGILSFDGVSGKYFGFDENSEKEVRNNIEVIYYDSENEKYIIKINTKDNDELYLYKGYTAKTFKGIYDEIEKYKAKSNSYTLSSHSKLYVPYISIKNVNEITNLENQKFKTKDGNAYMINKAIQTINLDLTEKGGKVKSEAGISFDKSIAIEDIVLRYDKDFALFIKEKDAKLPYLAITVNNLDEFQSKKGDK